MLKIPTTYQEQIQILKKRGCCIEDDDNCSKLLERVNYYRITAYLLPFKMQDGNYVSGTSLCNVSRIYEFDRKMRNILLSALEEVEVFFRAKLAYVHAHKYGADGFYNEGSFNPRHKQKQFLDEFENIVSKRKNEQFVSHHIKKYNRRFPIWVAVELFTFGMLSRFFSDLKLTDQKIVTRESFRNATPAGIESWLLCCTNLRNVCAHYGRIYGRIFTAIPKNIGFLTEFNKRKLYGAILALKSAFFDKDKWDNEYVPLIEALIGEFSDVIDLQIVGFTPNWARELRNFQY